MGAARRGLHRAAGTRWKRWAPVQTSQPASTPSGGLRDKGDATHRAGTAFLRPSRRFARYDAGLGWSMAAPSTSRQAGYYATALGLEMRAALLSRWCRPIVTRFTLPASRRERPR